jgi:hypothetical protein
MDRCVAIHTHLATLDQEKQCLPCKAYIQVIPFNLKVQLDADLATADKRIGTLFEKVPLPSVQSVTDPLMRYITLPLPTLSPPIRAELMGTCPPQPIRAELMGTCPPQPMTQMH